MNNGTSSGQACIYRWTLTYSLAFLKLAFVYVLNASRHRSLPDALSDAVLLPDGWSALFASLTESTILSWCLNMMMIVKVLL